MLNFKIYDETKSSFFFLTFHYLTNIQIYYIHIATVFTANSIY